MKALSFRLTLLVVFALFLLDLTLHFIHTVPLDDKPELAATVAPPPPAALEPLPPPADLALTPWQQRLTRIFRARDQTAAAAREIDDIMQRMDELHNILGEQLARSSNLMVLAKHQPPQTALATLDRASAISNANPRLQQEYTDLGHQLKTLAELYPQSLTPSAR